MTTSKPARGLVSASDPRQTRAASHPFLVSLTPVSEGDAREGAERVNDLTSTLDVRAHVLPCEGRVPKRKRKNKAPARVGVSVLPL